MLTLNCAAFKTHSLLSSFHKYLTSAWFRSFNSSASLRQTNLRPERASCATCLCGSLWATGLISWWWWQPRTVDLRQYHYYAGLNLRRGRSQSIEILLRLIPVRPYFKKASGSEWERWHVSRVTGEVFFFLAVFYGRTDKGECLSWISAKGCD